MKTSYLLCTVVCIVLLTTLLTVLYNNDVGVKGDVQPIQTPIQKTTMKITSTAFGENQIIPSTYTCDAAGTNPDLSWSNVPPDTASLVLIMDDPDVPTSIKPDGLFVHWVVYNIDPKTTGISASSAHSDTSEGTQGSNSSGKSGYRGPCPPDREHRYFFKLYALDQKLDLPVGASKADVEVKMAGHILEMSELMGRYDRIGRQK